MRNLKKLIAVFCALALLVTALSGLNFTALAATDAGELAQFQAEMAERDTLIPGSLSNQSRDDGYVYRMFRANNMENGTMLPAMNADDDTNGLFDITGKAEATFWGRRTPLGDLFEIPNSHIIHYAYDEYRNYAGLSSVYNVQEGTWIGAGLAAAYGQNDVNLTTTDGWKAAGYQFQVSATGETWVDISNAVTYNAVKHNEAEGYTRFWTENCMYSAWAIVQIPTGGNYKYLRITIPTCGVTANNVNLRQNDTWTSSRAVKCGQVNQMEGIDNVWGYALGSVLCSAFDLTQVTYTNDTNHTEYTQIPDYAVFTTAREQAWKAAMDSKKVLTPGTLDDMSTTEYMHAAFLSGDTDKEAGQTADQRFVDGVVYTGYQLATNTISAFPTSPYGNFWGLQNTNVKGINNVNGIGRGYGIYFNVVGGTSVAVALTANTSNMDMDGDGLVGSKGEDVVMDEDEARIFFTQMCHYQYSLNGLVWSDITPTLDYQSYGYEKGVSQTAVAIATVKLPANAKYYRIVPHVHTDSWTALNNGTALYGGDSGWANNSWHGGILVNQSIGDGLNGMHFGIAGAMASTTDLTTYEGTYNALPEGTKYTLTLPEGVTADKTSVKAKETVILTVADDKFMVSGSLRLDGERVLHKSDSTAAGEGAGNKYYITMPAKDAVVTVEFKDAAEVTAQDNFATIATSIHAGQDVRALRFMSRVNVNADGQVVIGGQAYDVAKVGMVFLPKNMLTGDLTLETADALNVEAKYLHDRTGKYIDYTCGVKNLSVALQTEAIVARAYITYVVDGELVTEYAAPQEATFATLNGGATVEPPAAE